MIDITGVDLVKFVQKVYDLSVPQGLGFLYYTTEPLSEEEAKTYIKDKANYSDCIIDMDYVHGRACKMNVWKKEGKLFIADSWYDHADIQLWELLDSVGIEKIVTTGEHGMACNCTDCRSRRGNKK